MRPAPATLPITYGGGDINASTNVILSNGMLDPWRAGGVQYNDFDIILASFAKTS